MLTKAQSLKDAIPATLSDDYRDSLDGITEDNIFENGVAGRNATEVGKRLIFALF